MRRHNLNLAHRPFVNQRPVARISGLLWGLGLVLLLVNVWLYWSFYQGQGQTRTRLAELDTTMDREQSRIRELENRLASIDLQAQNEQVAFLNNRIERRTFGWSVLFDALAEVLPRDVRLARLRPERQPSVTSRRQLLESDSPSRIPLAIDGQAKTHEDLYAFLDALIASRAFQDVNPRNEAQMQGGVVTFSLTTLYLPEKAVAQKTAPPESEETTVEDDATEPASPKADEDPLEPGESSQQARLLPGGAP